MQKIIRKLKRAVLNQDPTFCDMYADARARRAGEEYLRIIRQQLRERFGEGKKLSILDAGCQAGRLLIPLAEDGHRMIGIDASAFSLQRARRHAQERGVAVRLYRGDLAQLRKWVEPASLDVVVCAEVLYLCRHYEALLALLVQSLKPGGLVCVSHRPAAYFVASALQRGAVTPAAELLQRFEGASLQGHYHNWQTDSQLQALYERLGCSWLACEPIDHQDWAIDDASVTDDAAGQMIRSFRRDGVFHVPSYLLVIAQRASWASS